MKYLLRFFFSSSAIIGLRLIKSKKKVVKKVKITNYHLVKWCVFEGQIASASGKTIIGLDCIGEQSINVGADGRLHGATAERFST